MSEKSSPSQPGTPSELPEEAQLVWIAALEKGKEIMEKKLHPKQTHQEFLALHSPVLKAINKSTRIRNLQIELFDRFLATLRHMQENPVIEGTLNVSKKEEIEHPPRSSDLLGNEGAAPFQRFILQHPEDNVARLVYADWLKDHENPLEELIRAEHALRENRDFKKTPKLNEKRITAKRAHTIHTLSHFFPEPEDSPSPENSLWPDDWLKDGKLHTIGPSLPEKVIAAFAMRSPPKQVEILSTLLRLPEQFADGHSLLRRSQLITKNDAGQEGFWEQQPSSASPNTQGIWHPIPTYTESGNAEVFSLLRHLHTCPQEQRTILFQRALQGFDTLCITPRRPMPPIKTALEDSLQQNADRIPGGLDTSKPVDMWTQYDPASQHYNPANAPVYHPDRFQTEHGGQPLTAGYDITFIEDIRVMPGGGKEPTTAGYRSLPRSISARDALDLIHGRTIDQKKFDPQDYKGLIGWIPQQYCIANMARLHACGLPLDQDGETWRLSILPGVYFPVSLDVSNGYWDSHDGRVDLVRFVAVYRRAESGARVAHLVFAT